MAGVDLTLINTGTEVLRAVTVEVTGRSYRLGDISPGASKTVKVNPVSESHIVVRFPTGLSMIIDCYLEPGYGGEIRAKVTSQAVVDVKDEVTLPPFFQASG